MFARMRVRLIIGTRTANIMISLKPDTRLQTLFGKKQIRTVYLGLDEPSLFLQEISRCEQL